LLADHCDLYNAALEERREAWRMSRTSITYGAQPAQLRQIRHADPDGQGRHSFTAQQQTLRRLNAVFRAFYKRSKLRGGRKPARFATGAATSTTRPRECWLTARDLHAIAARSQPATKGFTT
jgi:hypothetical protein